MNPHLKKVLALRDAAKRPKDEPFFGEITKDTPVRAFHRPTRTWHFSVLSWPMPGYPVEAFRVDTTSQFPNLEDFECWEVTDVKGDAFRPVRKLSHLYAVYS